MIPPLEGQSSKPKKLMMRERRVASLLADRASDESIAAEMQMESDVVSEYVENILRKFGLSVEDRGKFPDIWARACREHPTWAVRRLSSNVLSQTSDKLVEKVVVVSGWAVMLAPTEQKIVRAIVDIRGHESQGSGGLAKRVAEEVSRFGGRLEAVFPSGWQELIYLVFVK